jgi:cytosine/adenosine deaminase-related metal-dependent hydrolase
MKDFLQSINAWPDSAPSGSWYSDPWAELLGDPSTWLLVHANFVSHTDLEHTMRLSNGNRLRIAYCPRTHAAFGFNDYPLDMFLNAECVVGLGTDSLASNPDLDVWNEAVFVARKFPHLGGERIFRMLTADGAVLLGCNDELGSISPGKRAALLEIRSPQRGSAFDWDRFFSDETTVDRWIRQQLN